MSESAVQRLKRMLKGDKKFIDDEVMDLAPNVANDLQLVKRTKLRQYFDEIKGLARMADANLSPTKIKVKLRLIASRIKYDSERCSGGDEKRAFQNLEVFIEAGVNYVIKKRREDITEAVKEFAVFFECVYGYHYAKARG